MQERLSKEKATYTELKDAHDKLNVGNALTSEELLRTRQQRDEEQAKVSSLQTEIAKNKVTDDIHET